MPRRLRPSRTRAGGRAGGSAMAVTVVARRCSDWTLWSHAERRHAAGHHVCHRDVALEHGVESLLMNHPQRLGHLHDDVDRRRAGRFRLRFRDVAFDRGQVPVTVGKPGSGGRRRARAN